MKVLLTYDFITTQPHVGKRGLERFDFLVSLLEKLGINTVVDDTSKPAFAIETFFSLHDEQYPNQLVNYIVPDLSVGPVADMIREHVGDVCWVIGYELSALTRKCFDELGIAYIDIWLSPYRFGKDVLFSLCSNSETAQAEIVAAKLTDQQLQNEADSLIAYCRESTPEEPALVCDSALLIGQLFIDKASQNGKDFVSLLDYVEQIRRIAQQHQRVYLLKHPLMPEAQFRRVYEALTSIDNLSYLQGQNVYRLMADERIKTVVAVSSSVVAESRFFGKQAVYLYRPVLTAEYVQIREAFFSAAWWAKLFGLDIRPEWQHFHCDNWLRAHFDAFYAYAEFVPGLVKPGKIQARNSQYQQLVNLVNKLESVNTDGRLFLWGAGSIAKLVMPLLQDKLSGVLDRALSDKQWLGIDVFTPAQLRDGDQVIVTAFKYKEQIASQINALGKNIGVRFIDDLFS